MLRFASFIGTMPRGQTDVVRNTNRCCRVNNQCRCRVRLHWSTIHSLAIIMILLLSTVTSASSSCAVCDCRPQEVWCEDRGLTTVPSNLPLDTKRLFLFNNNLTSIPAGAFTRLKGLELLDLSSNKLTSRSIKPGVFNGLKWLHDLTLSDNKLTMIEKNTFSGLDSLMRLYIEDNRISLIENNALGNFSQLVELKLSRNRITSFPRIVNCPSLRRLYLSHNRLVRLQARSLDNVNLEQLTLASNLLNQLPTLAFGATSNMRMLDISQNFIQNLPRIISNMTSLQSLNLSGNAISALPEDFLEKHRRMKVFDLRGLRLTSLPRGFIPRRVYLNIFDLSNNPWRCDCDIDWLPDYMIKVGGAMVNKDEIQCSSPWSLRGRQLISLSLESDLHCQGGSSVGTAVRQPPRGAPPTRKPTVDLCDALACANGATCHIVRQTGRPTCRCLAGWKGLLCDKPVFIPTPPTSTASPRPGDLDKPQLLFDRNMLTSRSVGIVIPTIGKDITVTVTEIVGNGVMGSPSTKTIRPKRHPYNVTNLQPGRRYNICISSVDVIQTSEWKTRRVEDKLCGEITTLTATIVEPKEDKVLGDETYVSEPKFRPEHKDVPPAETMSEDETYQTGDNSAVSDDNQAKFDLLVPVIIAGAAVVIISVAVIFFLKCYCDRKKMKHTNNNDVTGPAPECTNGREGLDSMGDEMQLMISPQRGHNTASHAASPLVTANGDMYQAPHPSYNSMGQVPHHFSAINMRESLGRSSDSSASVKGSQQAYMDNRQSSPNPFGRNTPFDDVRNIATPTGNVYNGTVSYITEAGPASNNRGQEFVSMQHGPSPRPMDPYAGTFRENAVPIGVVPMRSTVSTAVNQYHQRPIATTTITPRTNFQYLDNSTTMPSDTYPARSAATIPQYVPGPIRPSPKKQMYYPDTNGPVVSPNRGTINPMNYTYQSTLVT